MNIQNPTYYKSTYYHCVNNSFQSKTYIDTRSTLSFKSQGIKSNFFMDSRKLFNSYCENLSKEISYSESKNMLDLSDIPIDTLKHIATSELQNILKTPREKLLYIITGRSGSGKSTFVRKSNFSKNFYIPDADNIKRLLPDYKEKGPSYVHKASYIINRLNLSKALSVGANSIIQTTTTFNNIDEIIAEARKYDYKNITLIHIDVSEDTAISRCTQRAEARNNVINTDYIKQRKYIDEIVSTYKDPQKGINEIIVLDNNDYSFRLTDRFIINN